MEKLESLLGKTVAANGTSGSARDQIVLGILIMYNNQYVIDDTYFGMVCFDAKTITKIY